MEDDPNLWPNEKPGYQHHYEWVAIIMAAHWLEQAAAGEVPHGQPEDVIANETRHD